MQYPVSAPAAATLQLQIPVADQVRVPDLCRRRLIERKRLLDGEVHLQRAAVVDQPNALDLADLDPRRAHELPVPEAADIAELRCIRGGPIESDLAEHQ